MHELPLKRRIARLLSGMVLICMGSFVAWKSHDLSLAIWGSRLLAAAGGFIAVYGFMWVLGSSAIGLFMVLGGASFFFWSLWTVSSGGSDMDAARIGLWCGPLAAVIGLAFAVPFGRSKASKRSG